MIARSRQVLVAKSINANENGGCGDVVSLSGIGAGVLTDVTGGEGGDVKVVANAAKGKKNNQCWDDDRRFSAIRYRIGGCAVDTRLDEAFPLLLVYRHFWRLFGWMICAWE